MTAFHNRAIRHLVFWPTLMGNLLLFQAGRLAAQPLKVLHSFTGGNDGTGPFAGLVVSSNTFFGVSQGPPGGGVGPYSKSTVFKFNLDGSGFTTLHTFTPTSGAWPYPNSDGALRWPNGGLLLSGNTIFGTAANGGLWGSGTVFRMNTDGSGFTNLHQFTAPDLNGVNNDGSSPSGGLVLSGDAIYGTTGRGGDSRAGTIFRISTNGTGFAVIHSFNRGTDGAYPAAGLILSSNTLYGTTEGFIGDPVYGTVFKVDTDGTGFTILHSFTSLTGGSGYGVNSDGADPVCRLILSANTLYGTAWYGGRFGNGAVFRVNTDGAGFSILHHFTLFDPVTGTNGDGALPIAGLILWSNTLYGTAIQGGTAGKGTVFQVNTDGAGFAVLHHFTGVGDGADPNSQLIIVSNLLYGTAGTAGVSSNGTAFSLIPVSPPQIASQPLSRTNVAGSTAIFSVLVTGSVPLSYQWLKGTSPISQQTNSSLLLTNVSDGNAANYSVVITNPAGSVTSASATLTIIDRPQITGQPLSRTNIAGTTAIFNVVATGTPPLSYQWLKGNNPLLQQNGSTVSLADVSDADAAGYRVAITNLAGSVTSAQAALVVIDRPQITSQPVSRTNVAGTTASFSVAAMGTAPLSYQWLKGRSPMPGQKGSTLTLANVLDADSSAYSVVVTNIAGSATSIPAFLTVIDQPHLTVLRSEPNVILMWPTNVLGFTLQSTTNLGFPAVWSTVSSAPFTVSGQHAVTNLISSTNSFYRLSR